MIPRAKRFPLLDSLRAIAVIMVVLTHVSVTAGVTEGSWLRPYMTNSIWMIAIFFVLSAFLLYRPFVRARIDPGRRPDTLSYGWARFLRIVPAYWVALTICALWLGREDDVFSIAGIPIYYGFAQIYFDGDALGGLAVAWSLCVEVTFYALLPIWAWLMLRVPGATRAARIRGELIALALLALAGLGYRVLMITTSLHEHSAGVLALPAYLDWFAVGMMLAVMSVWLEGREQQPAAVRVIDRWPTMFWAAGLFLYWLVSTQVGPLYGYPGAESPAQVVEHVLLLTIAVALFLPAAFGDPERGFVRRIMANRVLLYLGMTSYAIYLWHIPVFEQLKRWDLGSVDAISPFLMWATVTLALTTVIATVSWYVLEKPVLSLKRLTRGWRPEPEPGDATAEPTANPSTRPALTR